MTRAAYTGHEAAAFSDYIDLDTGRMLHAEPGRTYDIAPASGRAAPDIPQPWFTPVAAISYDTLMLAREIATEPSGAAAEGDAAPSRTGTGGKRGGEAIPAAQDEHGTEEG